MIHIYIYENLVNGKVYIGQTNNMKRRDLDHIKGDKSMPIDSAIKKHGRHNFSLNTITIVDTKDQSNDTEIEWIARARHLLGEENVYNIGIGGNNSRLGIKASEETIKLLSAVHKGNTIWLGKKHTDESKAKMSKSRLGNTNSKGAIRSEETRLKMSLVKKGKPAHNKGKATGKSAHNKIYFNDVQIAAILADRRGLVKIGKDYNVSSTVIIRIKKENKSST
jgi:group I intron endonuclease